jgi:hypothetical protein
MASKKITLSADFLERNARVQRVLKARLELLAKRDAERRAQAERDQP